MATPQLYIQIPPPCEVVRGNPAIRLNIYTLRTAWNSKENHVAMVGTSLSVSYVHCPIRVPTEGRDEACITRFKVRLPLFNVLVLLKHGRSVRRVFYIGICR